MAVACFSNYVQARKQLRCLRLINCYIGRFYGRYPNLQFLKKLSKLFCHFADNLALAKFQCLTDTPLNHNLSQLLIKNLLPNFFGNFFYKCELCPLLFFGELIADFTRRKAALRTKVKSVKRNVLACLVYSFDYCLLVLKFR